MAFLCFKTSDKYLLIRNLQDFMQKDNLVRIQMPLSDFNLCQSTARNITTVRLQLCS